MNKGEILNEGLERLRQIAKSGEFRTVYLDKDDYIIRQHQELNEVYWFDEVHFVVNHTAPNGKTLSMGEFFIENHLTGEIEFFSEKQCQFDVITMAPTEMIAIPKERFTEILLCEAKVAFWLSHNMSGMYQETMDIAIERSLYPLKFNIINDIVRNHASAARPKRHSYMYQEAQRFGCTERAYTRVISELIDEGMLTKGPDNRSVIPVDIEMLVEYIESYHR
ncbi:Crp/Fnr family transcriptional regulator [Psychromonas aquimarina]|uniref:Crp/Fnr family transcriptional regulator n=1 Tax=Psychromonas aquimarina TaxID=444919 RepID=UPI00048B0DA1|nr:Crp/Fnr family transcriptional regulator [Psychromonas aquimarina]